VVEASHATAEVVGAASERYGHLAQRAVAFVAAAGGAAPEDALISHVFGGAGSPALWRPLLRQILGTDDGLSLGANGYWMATRERSTEIGAGLDDFVALDVETTGLRPLQQRVIEVAAIRFHGGVETGRLETLINPGRPVPAYVSQLTGISAPLLVDAPAFAAVADGLLDMLGSSLIVGHNVDFDISFVNAELKRSGRPPLVNERLDTLRLASRIVAGLRKPNLESVGRALGLLPDQRKFHRAGADAELTARVARRLVEQAFQEGITSLDDVRSMSAGGVSQRGRRGERSRAPLDRSLLANIPRLPGVYLMRDRFNHIVYVGKAKNLRDRVGSYYSQPLGYTRKMDGLLESLAAIDVEVVGSELEALLLESQLIKRYQPRYNTALRSFEHYPFIRVDIGSPWPRVTLTKARKEDGAHYFGPFRNKTGARKTVDLINRVVPLRTCTRSFKDSRSYGSPCLELDLGRCLGPCVGKADRDVYMALVRDVVRFLDGRDDVLYERLWQGLEDAAERLDFERAALLRRELLHLNGVVGAQRRLREAAETQTLLVVLPSSERGCREVLVVGAGRLWAQFRARRVEGEGDLSARLAAAWERFGRHGLRPIDHETVDETNILNRWLHQHAGHRAILPLDAPPSAPPWTELARRALDLADDDLLFEPQVVDEGGLSDEDDGATIEPGGDPAVTTGSAGVFGAEGDGLERLAGDDVQ